MSESENIAVQLIGGLHGGQTNIYDGRALGGWPPADEVLAVDWNGFTAVCTPELAGEHLGDEELARAVRYRKVKQSKVTVIDGDVPMLAGVPVIRGAEYEAVEDTS